MQPNPLKKSQAYLTKHHWKLVDYFSDQVKIGESFLVHLAGITVQNQEGQIQSGSAGSLDIDPIAIAEYELLERIMIHNLYMNKQVFAYSYQMNAKAKTPIKVEFLTSPQPTRWVYAKSNGFSIHSEQQKACENAAYELIERELILRSWLGAQKPILLSAQNLESLYEVKKFTFGSLYWQEAEQEVFTTGVFFFPLQAGLPLVYGFGAGADLETSIQKSYRECTQRLGFLWGESLPDQAPEFCASPAYHQEFYLYEGHHHYIRDWLNGKFQTQAGFSPSLAIELLEYGGLESLNLHLIQARAKDAIPLIFGKPLEHKNGGINLERPIHPIV